jgi:hypothetical protein
MNKGYFLLAITIILGMLSGCSGLSPAEATATPTPAPAATETPQPTATKTALPTATRTPTEKPPAPAPRRTLLPASTLTNDFMVMIGGVETVEEGGFTFRPPFGYFFDIDEGQVDMFNADEDVDISIFGTNLEIDKKGVEDRMRDTISAWVKRLKGKYKMGEPSTVTIDGVQGDLYDFEGSTFNKPIKGQVIIFMVSRDHYVAGYGISVSEKPGAKNAWDENGQAAFGEILQSMTFMPTQKVKEEGKCASAPDPTYGYFIENPIRVGGDMESGLTREKVFLDNLQGKNGEKVEYFWLGYEKNKSNTIDAYLITVGKTIQLIMYFDKYSYIIPKSPEGFTCKTAFRLSQP